MHLLTFIAVLFSANLITPSLAAAFANATTINTTPQTTLSSTTLTSSGSVNLPGVGTSTASNGSVTISISPVQTTIIVPNPTTPPVVAGEYKLRVQAVGNSPRRFNGMYLAAWNVITNYTADAVFTKNKTLAAKFYLNGTFEQVDFGVRGQVWFMNINYNLYNDRWYLVETKTPTGSGYGSFYLNGTGLQWTPNQTPPPHTGVASQLDNYFGGWFACDWWHGVPQLFWKVGLYNDTVLPVGCADVLLLQEYFK